MKIILGSQSEGRRKILESMGYTFEIMPADINEKAIRFEDPIKLTLAISNAKAGALLEKIKEPALLITSDQVVVCNGVIREKPVSADESKDFLESYGQYPAETVTSVVVVNTATGERVYGTDIAEIWFNPIPKEVIEAYIETGDPFLHSGGFDREHLILLSYVKKIQGEPDSVTGLPKSLTCYLLNQFLK